MGGGAGPGCFTHTKGIQISTAQLFWWEVRPAGAAAPGSGAPPAGGVPTAGMPACSMSGPAQTAREARAGRAQTIMTFTLVMVVYATAITKPGHGNIAPLAIGFALFASAFVGVRSVPCAGHNTVLAAACCWCAPTPHPVHKTFGVRGREGARRVRTAS